MLTHIVVWKYRADVSQAEREDHVERLRSLKSVVTGIESVSVGFDTLHLSRSYDTGLVAVFDDRAAQRVAPSSTGDYVDYQGVIHVHSSLGGHSTGNFAELISAAKANQLDFVIMTEHPQKDFDTAAMTVSGMHAGVLFINGNEVN